MLIFSCGALLRLYALSVLDCFKLFNKIETWEALEAAFGDVTLANYSFAEFDAVLSARQDSGERNYSAAYIMPSAGRVFGHRRKHSNAEESSMVFKEVDPSEEGDLAIAMLFSKEEVVEVVDVVVV